MQLGCKAAPQSIPANTTIAPEGFDVLDEKPVKLSIKKGYNAYHTAILSY